MNAVWANLRYASLAYSERRSRGEWKYVSPPELEEKLAQSAAKQGRRPDDLVVEVLAQHFEEEARFMEAVKLGEEALQRGEFLMHQQVGERLERFLKS
jgi:predicted transcriptional regulator